LGRIAKRRVAPWRRPAREWRLVRQGQGEVSVFQVFTIGFGCWVLGVMPPWVLCVTRGSCAKGVVRGAQPYLGARTVVVLARRHDDR
jgi:hypothetical protein